MAAERHGTCERRAAAVVVVGLILLAALVAEARAAAAKRASLQSQDTNLMTPCSGVLHHNHCAQPVGGLKRCCVEYCHAESHAVSQVVSQVVSEW
jgi:hypothetical protein